ncbi:MAG: YidC/Oxa1 family membrane protein insertase [Ruminococcaceae bacterium]|nr:YidC/Oxa1 family membrane protein insertase [Oscillospiraceae bacterium]
MDFLGFLGKPLGAVMSWIYSLVPNYFVTIFLFTFVIRLILFPLNLKQQKGAMDRARLAPALERLQKKYANDRNKLMEKQQALYEKHGVSMTGGCLPMLLSMIVLFGVIAAIYAPLTNLSSPSMSEEIIGVAQYAIIGEGEGKLPENDLKGYYGELRLMTYAEANKEDILKELTTPSAGALQRAYPKADILNNTETYESYKAIFEKEMGDRSAEEVYNQLVEMKDQFSVMNGKFSLLEQPWNSKGFLGINWLWLIPLISGLTSFAVSYISLSYNKRSMPQDQPGQGCTNNMMLIYMPVFSTWIAFTVPGAVGVYWIFSNVLSVVQTVLMNKIYDPAKARAEAEAKYLERRRQKEEDKKRLARARQREEAQARKEEQERERQREESREMNKKKKKKGHNTGTSSAQAEDADAQDGQDAVTEPNSDEASED